MNLNEPGTLVQLRDQQIQTAINAIKASYTIDSKLEDAIGDDTDERLLTDEQQSLLVRAVKCLESVMEDEF